MPTTEAGDRHHLWRDLYFVLGDPAPDGGCAVRLYYNPLVLWIWGGAAIMALGGLSRSPTGGCGSGRRARRAPPAGHAAAGA